MEFVATSALFLLVAGILSLSAASWTYAVRRYVANQRPNLHENVRQPPPRWGIIDLALNVIVYVLFTVLAVGVVRNAISATDAVVTGVEQSVPSPTQKLVLLAAGIAQVLAVIAGTLLLRLRAGKTAVKSVWSLREFRGDLKLALYAFGLVILPVFLLQAALTQIIQYEHPAITPFRESRDWTFFACAAFSAVLSAPLGEEFFFRGLFQGWLERFASFGAANWEDLFALQAVSPRVVAQEAEVDNAPEVVAPELISNPYLFAGNSSGANENLASVAGAEPVRAVPHWPLWVVSGIFALMHISQGAAPAPLFFFSVAMGYVYRHTGRIMPSLIMHVMLNGFSMAMLGLSTLIPSPT